MAVHYTRHTLAAAKQTTQPCREPGTSAILGRRLHVVFVMRSSGFPRGMAATNRARLLGRSLVEQNVDVGVLCTRVSERPGLVRNVDVQGVAAGIPYEYTCGSTVRSDSFIGRRYREARGYAMVLLRLAHRKRSNELDCVYLWAGNAHWQVAPWLLVQFLKCIRVPVMVELNERPWTASPLPKTIGKHMSLLDGISGAVAISSWLVSWASMESTRIGKSVRVAEIPIVVDVGEQAPQGYGEEDPLLVYAASPAYRQACWDSSSPRCETSGRYTRSADLS